MSNNNELKTSPDGFGRRLVEARKARGYSVEKVAEELNILKRYIQAFEEENFSALPQFIYARGFLVNYAKFVGLDGEEIARLFERSYPDNMRQKEVVSPLTPMGTVVRGRSLMRINLWLVAGVIGLVVFGFILLKIINTATSKKEEPDFTTSSQVLTPAEQAQGASIGGSGSAINIAGNNTNQVNDVAISDTGVVDIWSKGDVSIKITDKNGNVLMQGLQSRGGYQLKGNVPLTVEIDNPAQVDLSFNQKPVRLGEYTKNGRAMFSLQ
ncbi:helix-turn-helix domain-containing protein [Moraxella oblonga]|uniref:helix-turn-helix domain-containing protein n=1 Tax=Moraxella oblonga TaxID=200413 RepID=UPI00082EF169|nr:helix-turn-helix domain-containing protein [Moraxella oblonga]